MLLLLSGSEIALTHHLYGFLPIDLIFISLLLVMVIYTDFRLKSATFWLIILPVHSLFAFINTTNVLALVHTHTSLITNRKFSSSQPWKHSGRALSSPRGTFRMKDLEPRSAPFYCHHSNSRGTLTLGGWGFCHWSNLA